MKVKDLSDLTVSPTAGGTTGEWITRFTTYNPHTPGNGHIYYAGMESVAGQTPRFFAGDTAAPPVAQEQVSMLFDSQNAVPGSVQGNTITIHVPWSAVPAVKKGATLYSAIISSGLGTFCAIPAGDRNMPEPIVMPITSATELQSPSRRGKPPCVICGSEA